MCLVYTQRFERPQTNRCGRDVQTQQYKLVLGLDGRHQIIISSWHRDLHLVIGRKSKRKCGFVVEEKPPVDFPSKIFNKPQWERDPNRETRSPPTKDTHTTSPSSSPQPHSSCIQNASLSTTINSGPPTRTSTIGGRWS